MELHIAKDLGFCGGVYHAVNLAYRTVRDSSSDDGALYLYGPLVHNAKVVDDFLEKGAKIINNSSEITSKGTVIIRAHGIGFQERERLIEKGLRVVDCTCPVVLKGQNYVHSSALPVIIFGYKGHSEVEALRGSRDSSSVWVCEGEEDLLDIKRGEYNGVVQTTFSSSLLDSLLNKAQKEGIRVNLLNQICNASNKRRAGLIEILDRVDAVVVVGDHNSANTRELRDIVLSRGKECFLVEDEKELPIEIYSFERVGLSAGASTPKDLYDKVIKKLEENI